MKILNTFKNIVLTMLGFLVIAGFSQFEDPLDKMITLTRAATGTLLKTYFDEESGINTIVYQPDSAEGKDASVGTHLYLDIEDKNYGSDINCGAWASDGGGDGRGLIEFDLSSLPHNVISAKLRMHGVPRGQQSGIPNEGDVSVYQVTSPWQEMSVTWNTMPSFDSVPIDTEVPDSERWFEWDITTLYNDWKSGSSDNHGLFLINHLEGTRTTGIILKSSDYSDPSLLPTLILTYEIPVIEANLDLNPKTLNLKSKGKWVTAYIELSDSYDLAEIDISTVILEDTITAESRFAEIGDFDDDGIPDLMVKFDRQMLIEYLAGTTGDVTLTVSGEYNDSTTFEGRDTIRVINPGK